MAIALGAHAKVTGSGVTTLTTPGVTTQASGSSFYITISDTTLTTSVSDSKSNSYTQVGSDQSNSTGLRVFQCQNGTGGASHTATVNWTSGSGDPFVCFFEVTGAATSSYDSGSLNQGTNNDTLTVTTGTLAQAAELVIATVSTNSSGASLPVGFTLIEEETNGGLYWPGEVCYKIVAATTAVGATFISLGSTMVATIFGVKEASGGGGTTVSITGNASTLSPGTVLPATASALTGNAGTFGPGTVKANTSNAITGNSATFTLGTVVPNTTVALTGNQAVFTPGAVSTGNDVVVSITGWLAAFAPGTLLPATTSALIGQAATLSAGTVQATTTRAISGQTGTFTSGSVAASNTVALSGNQALFTPGQVNYVGDVTVAITGNAILCTAGIVGVDSGQVLNSAGWLNATRRPDRETVEQKKRLRWRAYDVIKQIEQIPKDNTESLDVLQKEARKVSRELAMTINQLESALKQPVQSYGQASQQWDRKQQRQETINTQVMLETQLESFQQQQEELDVAFVMMMMLHAIEDFY